MVRLEKIKYSVYDHVFGFIPAEDRNRAQAMYFVGHAYGYPFSQDLRRAVRQAFEPNLVPYFADLEVQPRHILIKIARKIYTTRFGVFDLTHYSPNVYLELGIALGVNKPIIPIFHENSKEPVQTGWTLSMYFVFQATAS